MKPSIGTTIDPGDLPVTWEWDEKPRPVRVGRTSPFVNCHPQSIRLAMRATELLTAAYDCPFCGLLNEAVIADFVHAMRNCSHCSAVHFIGADKNPPWVNANVIDNGRTKVEVVPLPRPRRTKRTPPQGGSDA